MSDQISLRKYCLNYIILILLLSSCNTNKYLSYKKTLDRETTVTFSKGFQFSTEVLSLVKKVNNRKILGYEVKCTDKKISNGVYIILKKEYTNNNQPDEFVCVSDSGLTKVSDNISICYLKSPKEVITFKQDDIDSIKELLNKFEPPNKLDIIAYLSKCIGFSKVR